MKQIIPKDSRYITFTQQKSCCVPACLSIIMYKNKIPLVTQEVLGYHLGLIVAPKSKKLFWNARTVKKPKAGYGTQIYKKQYSLNPILRKLKIPLKMKLEQVNDLSKAELVQRLEKAEKKNEDICVCFDHGMLSKDKTIGHGHVCVFDRIYAKQNKIRLIDPSPNRPKWRMVNITQLKKAMEYRKKRSGGLWVFS